MVQYIKTYGRQSKNKIRRSFRINRKLNKVFNTTPQRSFEQRRLNIRDQKLYLNLIRRLKQEGVIARNS